ncbi:4a-hydroxytetrahydrobiopterin dehydratase [Enterovirga sp.]|uniref:4a-hydroxytetrahydrobiopterin dehydratase n=1 Tax=Enterovirga sp. TaxID=2026350 RepID=UPI002627A822|nr:4a-hydroxytetrahydrobiopterin dehydratase [Enterovirga sp.]MDB5590068.1 transcriptional coactivator/pterin dehydratase [Enterovirga sp.]
MTVPLLDEAAIAGRLRELPGWTREGVAIARLVRLKGFARPLLLANAVGHLAEAANHHPDLAVSYGSLRIRLTTHDAGGLTDRDFTLAARIEALLD